MTSPVVVAVCVPTYRRPEYLAALLASLAGLQTEGLVVRVVVVDNDAAGSARRVVESFNTTLPELVYEIEPERGIAAARNRLVATSARIDADYVAFVDDDEWVEPSWLRNFVRAALDFDAEVVAGPALPDYDRETPEWVITGRFFERKRHRTGEQVRANSTRNLLIKLDSLERVCEPFDRRFDLIGGSDTHLLERLHRQGVRIVWCDEAVVHERIPVTRGNAWWIIRRAFRTGVTFSQCVILLNPALSHRAIWMAKALVRFGQAAIALPLGLCFGRIAAVRSLCRCAQTGGRMLGMAGYAYREYRHVHGR